MVKLYRRFASPLTDKTGSRIKTRTCWGIEEWFRDFSNQGFVKLTGNLRVPLVDLLRDIEYIEVRTSLTHGWFHNVIKQQVAISNCLRGWSVGQWIVEVMCSRRGHYSANLFSQLTNAVVGSQSHRGKRGWAKKVENLWDKISCKWSSLNAPGSHTPWCRPLLNSSLFPFETHYFHTAPVFTLCEREHAENMMPENASNAVITR